MTIATPVLNFGMKPEQQRIAIAEACGWMNLWETEVGDWRGDSPQGLGDYNIPNYLNDLNAMHEAEKWLFASNIGHYERRYAMLLSSVVSNYGEPFEEYAPDGLRDICDCIHATAAHRAEAFLRLLGLWEPSE